jgi:predicted RNA-binding protein (virulence factor B family)
MPGNVSVGDEIDVFLYYDSSDRIIATTMKPKAVCGEFAMLRVSDVNQTGAFLDWGLEKDLLVPYREQKAKMQKGKTYLVHIFLDDKTARLLASAKLDQFLNLEAALYEPNQEVDLIIMGKGELGYTAIVNNKHQGMLYFNEVFKELSIGKKLKGYIVKVREDGKIDLHLEKPGIEKLDDLSFKIITLLKKNGGFMRINDNSPADEIHHLFGTSKKNFKKALGSLYKQRLVSIEEKGIHLLK